MIRGSAKQIGINQYNEECFQRPQTSIGHDYGRNNSAMHTASVEHYPITNHQPATPYQTLARNKGTTLFRETRSSHPTWGATSPIQGGQIQPAHQGAALTLRRHTNIPNYDKHPGLIPLIENRKIMVIVYKV